MKYLLDIIIPCYNSENTLNNTVKSIEVQNTNFEFEIIIVDDGSTDKTSEVIDHLKNRYLNIRSYYQQNLKQSMARNIGIRHSIAKYIMFVDSDDILEPDMLRTMIGEMNIKGYIYIGKVDMGRKILSFMGAKFFHRKYNRSF